ncbi:MAG TPA: hypothetical protein VHQ90_00895 [Thermoanaerobaculia bacterium]|nr:hypothetical protein [Thermoanaerobaculia bacterium]
MVRNYRLAILCFALPVIAGSVAARAETFAIKLSRSSVVGQRDLLSASVQEDLVLAITVEGREIKHEDHSTCRFTVAQEILQVSPKGNPLRASLTVRSFTCEENGVSTQLKVGDVIAAHLDAGDTVFELRGAALPSKFRAALETVFALHSDDESSEDEAYGTSQRRSLGESWSVNPELVAKRMMLRHLIVAPEDVSGSVTLVGRKSVANRPCLEVRSTLELRNAQFASRTTSSDLKMRVPVLRYAGTKLVPLDPSLPLPEETERAEGPAAVTGMADDVDISAGATFVVTVHSERAPIR